MTDLELAPDPSAYALLRAAVEPQSRPATYGMESERLESAHRDENDALDWHALADALRIVRRKLDADRENVEARRQLRERHGRDPWMEVDTLGKLDDALGTLARYASWAECRS